MARKYHRHGPPRRGGPWRRASSVVAVVVVVALELGANLASRVFAGVDIGVRHAGADRIDELGELAGGDALVGGADHLGWAKRAAHAARRGGTRRRRGRRGWGGGGEEHHDFTALMPTSQEGMSLGGV